MRFYNYSIVSFLVSIYFWYYATTLDSWHFIDNANLIFHEVGHTIFFFLGDFVQVLMGSGFQILLPLFISVYFFLLDQKLSAALCLFWVGQNFLNVSVYAKDAIVMQLPLLGGDSSIHDWNYILNSLGILQHTSLVANILYFIGILLIFIGTIFSLYFANLKDNSPKTL